MNQLVDESDRLADAFLRKPEISGKPEYNHLDLRRGLLKEKALLALVSNSKTVPLLVQLLSPNIHLHSTTVIYKRPENRNDPPFRRGWHRDIRIPKDRATNTCRLSVSKFVTALLIFNSLTAA